MTTHLTGRAHARHAAHALRVTTVAAVVGIVASGLSVPRAAAQEVGIPSISVPKAAATRAAAATNAHTAAMQQVDAPAAPRSGATASAPSARARSTAMPAVSVSAPQTGKSAPAPSQAVVSVASAPHGKATATPSSATAPAGAMAKGAMGKGNAAAMSPAPMTADTEPMSISVTQRGVKGEVSLNREVYSYDPGARRDPFISLMQSGDLRPMLSDLRLVTVLYDPTGQSSIAVMRDQSTKDQYRVRVGQTLGRMRVAQIQPKQVVFTIEEVGFSRQEALALGDTTKARTQ